MTAPQRPVFYYDLGSPYAYLAAERINQVLPVVPIWQPILLGGIWKETGGGSWARTDKRDEGMAEVERRAREYGLQPHPLARPVAHQHAPRHARRHLLPADRPRGRVLTRRLPPGLRRRHAT